MTAPFTTLDRNLDADASRYEVYRGPNYAERAGRVTFSTKGQLWERARGRKPALTGRAVTASRYVRNAATARRARIIGNARGPLVVDVVGLSMAIAGRVDNRGVRRTMRTPATIANGAKSARA